MITGLLLAAGISVAAPADKAVRNCLEAKTLAVHSSARFHEISQKWDKTPWNRIISYLGGKNNPADGGYELKFPSRRDVAIYDATINLDARLISQPSDTDPKVSALYHHYEVTFKIVGKDAKLIHSGGTGFLVRRDEAGAVDFTGYFSAVIPPSCDYTEVK